MSSRALAMHVDWVLMWSSAPLRVADQVIPSITAPLLVVGAGVRGMVRPDALPSYNRSAYARGLISAILA